MKNATAPATGAAMLGGMATVLPTLHRRRDGYWEASWTDVDGVQHRPTFGKDGAAAKRKFAAWLARWQSDPLLRQPSLRRLTIRAGWLQFKAWAEPYYRRADGSSTGEAREIGYAMKPVLELYGDLPAAEFGPAQLKAARERMIAADLCTNVVNHRVRRIRQVFRWLVAEGRLPAEVWHGLQAVMALQRGRSAARDTARVGAVPEAYVRQVCEIVTPTIAAMVQLQWLTGMRPGELCQLRPCDIDMTQVVWVYRPAQHKNLWRGIPRVVMIGPQGQALLRPLLPTQVERYVFSPRQSERERYGACDGHRHQPVEQAKTQRRLGDRYESGVYSRRIREACKTLGIPAWSPNQLRHAFATRVAREAGEALASVGLGHASFDTTKIYVERNVREFAPIIMRIG